MDHEGKNYSIEVYRIIATVMICAHHFYTLPLYYNNRAVFVEFFFILSGYFLMLSFDREQSHSCAGFCVKRLRRLYPEYFLAYVLLLAAMAVKQKFIPHPETVISELFFLKSMGIFPGGYNYPGWYVCTLFWGEILLYSGMAYNRRLFSRVIAPLVTIFGYIWLFNCGRGLGNLEIWESFYPLLRALCGLCLGVTAYEIRKSDVLRNLKLWQGTVIELISITVIVYSVNTDENLWALAILSFFVLVLVTVYQKGYLSAVILNHRIFGTLSKLTYGMYLNQVLMILVTWHLVNTNYGWKAWTIYFVGLVCTSAVLYLISEKAMAWLRKRREN